MSQELCRAGELCGGRKHVKKDDEWVQCSCYYFDRRDRWYDESGFPDAIKGKTAQEIIALSGYGARLTAEGLRGYYDVLRTSPRKALFFQSHDGVIDPLPISSWLSYYLATLDRIALVKVRDMVDDAFDDRRGIRGRVDRIVKTVPFLTLRIGQDPKHSWNGSMLLDAITHRTSRRMATMISVTAPIAGTLDDLYGLTTMKSIYDGSVLT